MYPSCSRVAARQSRAKFDSMAYLVVSGHFVSKKKLDREEREKERKIDYLCDCLYLLECDCTSLMDGWRKKKRKKQHGGCRVEQQQVMRLCGLPLPWVRSRIGPITAAAGEKRPMTTQVEGACHPSTWKRGFRVAKTRPVAKRAVRLAFCFLRRPAVVRALSRA